MKIDLNNLYIASLHMLEGYRNNHTKYVSSKFKNIVVYRDLFGNFFDFVTGKRYKTSNDLDCYYKIGTIFIKLQDGLIPLTKVITFEEYKMSKSKILQKVKSSNIK